MNNDLISREILQYRFDNLCPHIECKKCRWYSMEDSFHKCALIENAPTVEYPFYQEAYQTGYEEGYAQGYIEGSTSADWKGGAE